MTVPVKCVDEAHGVELDEEAASAPGLTLDGDRGQEALCLAILTATADGAAAANLRAPVVIHRAARRACQAIQFDSGYSFHHPLTPPAGDQPC